MSILPTPLHPLMVHLPIALTVLTPLFAVGALWAVKRGTPVRAAWGLATALLLLLFASSWVAIQTGEQEEERVEQVVREPALEGHEEAAEQFLWVTGLVALVATAGLLRGRAGDVTRMIATAGTVAVLVAGYRVGHSGGALVYQEGAASAYVTGAPALSGENAARRESEGDDRD